MHRLKINDHIAKIGTHVIGIIIDYVRSDIRRFEKQFFCEIKIEILPREFNSMLFKGRRMRPEVKHNRTSPRYPVSVISSVTHMLSVIHTCLFLASFFRRPRADSNRISSAAASLLINQRIISDIQNSARSWEASISTSIILIGLRLALSWETNFETHIPNFF